MSEIDTEELAELRRKAAAWDCYQEHGGSAWYYRRANRPVVAVVEAEAAVPFAAPVEAPAVRDESKYPYRLMELCQQARDLIEALGQHPNQPRAKGLIARATARYERRDDRLCHRRYGRGRSVYFTYGDPWHFPNPTKPAKVSSGYDLRHLQDALRAELG